MEQRKRVNAKQTAKGEWQIDCTVEITDETIVSNDFISKESIDLVKAVEHQFTADGRRIAGDN